MDEWIDLHAIWQIVVFGLIAGAGLPAIFAIGLKALALPGGGRPAMAADSEEVYGGNVAGLALACLCFAVVLAGIGFGVYFIVDGS